jgi:putative salt-induced outer membrane protein YdiY
VQGSSELSFVSTTGNSTTQSIGAQGELFYRPRPTPWVFQTKVAFVRLTSNGDVKAKSLAVLFRGIRDLSPRLSTFGQYDYLRNLFAGVRHRNTLTSGVAYKAAVTKRQTLTLRAGFGAAIEQRLIDRTDTSGAPTEASMVTRGTATEDMSYALKLSATSDVTDDLHVEESVADAGDWRFNNQLALTTRIVSIVSLKVSNVVRYVNEPVPTFERTDTVTSVSFVVKF